MVEYSHLRNFHYTSSFELFGISEEFIFPILIPHLSKILISSHLLSSSLIYSNDSQMSKSARSIIQYPGFDEFFVFIICQMIHTRREIPNPVNIQRTIPSTIATMAGLAQAVASFIHRGYHSIPPESISSFSSISVI